MMSSKVFISYSNTQNTELNQWIESFSSFLNVFLHNYVSKHILIENSKTVSDISNIKNFNYYIVVVDSEYFVNQKSKSEFDIVSNKLQGKFDSISLIKIEDISNYQLAEVIRLHSYKFFVYDDELQKNVRISGDVISDNYLKFWTNISDIGFDIKQCLEGKNKFSFAERNKLIVYLAETDSIDDSSFYEIKRELIQNGYLVLPNNLLDVNKSDLEQNINNILSQSVMSVHIVEDFEINKQLPSQTNIVEYQNDIAAAYCINSNSVFKRLIWINPNTVNRGERAELFIQKLHKKSETLAGGEIIQTPLQLFKQIMIEKLQNIREAQNANDSKPEFKPNTFYVITDSSINVVDEDILRPLKTDNRNVVLLDSKQRIDILEQHRKNLVDSDFFVIIFANSNLNWLNSKLTDIMKSPGFGRLKPIKNNVVVNCTNTEIDSRILKKYDFLNICSKQNFHEVLRGIE